jgi:predicted DNA-binding WGR domain protein
MDRPGAPVSFLPSGDTPMRRFEFVDGKSNKFWETKTEGPKLMVRFGRIGGTWQESDKLLANAEKANAEMEKLIREKTRKGYLEVGGKPEVKVLAKAVAKKAKTKEPKPQSMEATISPAERKAKAQKVLLMFANGQWELAHNILETAQDEEWLFEQLLNGCKIEDGKPIPSIAIKKAIKEDEKSNPVLAMLNIMLCIPDGSKLLKTFNFEKLKELDFGAVEGEEMTPWIVHVLRLLPRSEISVVLYGLTSLSDAAAEALSKHEGELDLSGLESLSDTAAEALSKCKCELDLSGLAGLSDAAAEALSKYKGRLSFENIKSLSDAASNSLSKHKGELDLRELKSLSDSPGHVALAKKLASQKGYLCLSGLASLSDAAAVAFSKHDGGLNFYGLKSLSDVAAEAFSKCNGYLDLSGLASLSDSAAEAFSKHKRDLHLNSLKSLSDAGAEALSKCEGDLNLSGLKSLSDAGAKALAKKKGGKNKMKLPSEIQKKVDKYRKK